MQFSMEFINIKQKIMDSNEMNESVLFSMAKSASGIYYKTISCVNADLDLKLSECLSNST